MILFFCFFVFVCRYRIFVVTIFALCCYKTFVWCSYIRNASPLSVIYNFEINSDYPSRIINKFKNLTDERLSGSSMFGFNSHR